MQLTMETLEINPRYVAVARNGSVVRREEWPQVVLEDGDVLEIVRMVGGGCQGWAFTSGGTRRA